MSRNTKMFAIVIALALGACAKKDQIAPQPVDVKDPAMTGNKESEQKTVTEKKTDLEDGAKLDTKNAAKSQPKAAETKAKAESDGQSKSGQTLYVNTDTLNVRSSASRTGEVLGQLNQNDKVRIVKKGPASSEFVQVEIVETMADIKKSEAYFVGFRYLAATPIGADSNSKNAGSLFVIQNIATEKLRVYQKQCQGDVCRNKLVMNTDIVVGEDDENDTRTVLGSFKITKWVKFYQDGAGLYPSWYDPSYPPMPERGKGFGAWRDDKALPNGKGAMRGAFGWYTALVGPNSHNQWTHGTIGWGVDKEKYIRLPKKWYVNMFGDPRSHGCTRNNNEAIAYLRQILPVGTPIFKVYTHEAIYDPTLTGYSKQTTPWEYILTKNGVRTDGQKADRKEVLASGTPQSQWLEEGTYDVMAYPETKKITDRYKAGKENIRGTYYVDVGLLDGYSHPAGLVVGGSKEPLPNYLTYKLGAPLAESKDKKDKKKDEDKKDEKDG